MHIFKIDFYCKLNVFSVIIRVPKYVCRLLVCVTNLIIFSDIILIVFIVLGLYLEANFLFLARIQDSLIVCEDNTAASPFFSILTWRISI